MTSANVSSTPRPDAFPHVHLVNARASAALLQIQESVRAIAAGIGSDRSNLEQVSKAMSNAMPKGRDTEGDMEALYAFVDGARGVEQGLRDRQAIEKKPVTLEDAERLIVFL